MRKKYSQIPQYKIVPNPMHELRNYHPPQSDMLEQGYNHPVDESAQHYEPLIHDSVQEVPLYNVQDDPAEFPATGATPLPGMPPEHPSSFAPSEEPVDEITSQEEEIEFAIQWALDSEDSMNELTPDDVASLRKTVADDLESVIEKDVMHDQNQNSGLEDELDDDWEDDAYGNGTPFSDPLWDDPYFFHPPMI